MAIDVGDLMFLEMQNFDLAQIYHICPNFFREIVAASPTTTVLVRCYPTLSGR